MAEVTRSRLAADRVARSQALLQSCVDYLGSDFDDVEPFDYLLTKEATRSLFALAAVEKNEGLATLADDTGFVVFPAVWPNQPPQVLESGLAITINISPALRQPLLSGLKGARDLESQLLKNLYEQAESEAQSLLVDGKTRSVAEKLTMGEVYNDAEIYYDAYVNNDDEGALKGFLYLKSLNPFDAYFRDMVGACYSRLGRHAEALRELTYARALDLDNVRIASNLLRCLDVMGLYPAALDIHQDFEERYLGNDDDGDFKDGVWFGRIAEFVSMALANLMFGTSEDEISSPGPEFLSEAIPALEEPWTVGR